jgi:acetyl/propionyl-CoA carboxylase alpha subunit
MTFEIELGGIRRTVSIEPAGAGRYRVSLDGHVREVLAERAGEFSLALILDEATGLSREVNVAAGSERGELLVGLGGRTVTVAVDGRRRRSGADRAAMADGEHSIVAPMPGRVVRVLVAQGDDVAAREGVIVVEAMKMENELRSPKAGRVKSVAVTPGTLVEAGRVLVVIE